VVNAVVVVEIVVEDVVVVLPLVMMMKIRKHGTASGVAVPVFAGGFAMVGGGVRMTRVARVVVPESLHHITPTLMPQARARHRAARASETAPA